MERLRTFFQKLSLKQTSSGEKKNSLHPYRDWGVVFFFTLTSFFLFAGVGGRFFLTLDFQEKFGGEVTPRPLPTEDLEETLRIFEERKERFLTLQASTTRKSDPSL